MKINCSRISIEPHAIYEGKRYFVRMAIVQGSLMPIALGMEERNGKWRISDKEGHKLGLPCPRYCDPGKGGGDYRYLVEPNNHYFRRLQTLEELKSDEIISNGEITLGISNKINTFAYNTALIDELQRDNRDIKGLLEINIYYSNFGQQNFTSAIIGVDKDGRVLQSDADFVVLRA